MKRIIRFFVSIFALVPVIIYAWWPDEDLP